MRNNLLKRFLKSAPSDLKSTSTTTTLSPKSPKPPSQTASTFKSKTTTNLNPQHLQRPVHSILQ